MRFLHVIQNEFIKLMKKKSTIILLVILFLCVIGVVGYTKLMIRYNYTLPDTQEYMESLKTQITNLEDKKKSNELSFTPLDKANLQYMTYAYDHKMNILLNNYLSKIYGNLLSLHRDKEMAQKEQNLEKVKQLEEKITRVEEIFYAQDFDRYIEFCQKELEEDYANHRILKEKYEVESYLFDLRKKYQIGKSYDSKTLWKEDVLSLIDNIKYFQIGITNSSVEEKKFYEEQIALAIYCLENNNAVSASDEKNTNDTFHHLCEEIVFPILTIVMIIIAGSITAIEFSKRSMKHSVVVPVQRWKILLAKIVVLLLLLFVVSIVLSLLIQLLGDLFFGTLPASNYVYMSQGVVKEIPSLLYYMARFLLQDITIFIYMMFTMMLVVIFRSSTLPLGITSAIYAVNLGFNVICNEWTKLIPFYAFDLKNIVFHLFLKDYFYSPDCITLPFAIIQLLVILLLIFVTMLDSFRKQCSD